MVASTPSKPSLPATGRLSGRVAVVTGAAHGLAQAFAERLAAEGADIAVADLVPADDTVAKIEALGRRAYSETLDVTDEAAVNRFAKSCDERLGKVDILLNIAGIYPFQPFDEMTFADWRKVMSVNLDAGFLLAKAFVPGMKARRWGRVVGVTSNTCWVNDPNFLHYVTSKMGVVGFTRALASEVGGDGITVNCIGPSLTRTYGTEHSPAAGIFDTWHKGQAIPRLEEPGDLAGAVAFLCSDDAAFITGQTLMVDGGMVRL